jgi:hypothetical protein
MEACIIIPSHIQNISRTKLLMISLQSLINQSVKIPIYMSISFETTLSKSLFEKCMVKYNLCDIDILHIVYQIDKTSQFRHIENIINIIKDKFKFVLFCDDDDTYNNMRVEKFMFMVNQGYKNCPKDKKLTGFYERQNNESHCEKFYEYWSYCVNIDIIINFFNIIKKNNYDYYIDNKFCDILFSTFLRRLDNTHWFCSINETLYNYNDNENNKYSITNIITNKNSEIQESFKCTNFNTYIKSLNNDIETNIININNNVFIIYSMYKSSLKYILKHILKNHYKYIDNIDKRLLNKIKVEYNNIKNMCSFLYQQ